MYSRSGKDFSARFPSITRGFDGLPDETLIDGEVVGVDESGRPSFSTPRNFDLAPAFYALDLPTLSGDELMKRTLDERPKLLRERIRRAQLRNAGIETYFEFERRCSEPAMLMSFAIVRYAPSSWSRNFAVPPTSLVALETFLITGISCFMRPL